jgi:predicted transposase/invertase (TIGR01784 family)
MTAKKNRVFISFDYALKRLLRNKANYEVLEGFLSELLMRDIKVKSIAESETNKEHAENKYNRVDILVEDGSGEVLIIELQFTPEIDYFHRMLYGTSKVISERMTVGTPYMKVSKVYSINIVYFDLGQGEDYVYHGKSRFRGLHFDDELQLSEAQRTTFQKAEAGDIYPEYYILKINKFNDVAKDTLDEWVYFLKHNEIKDDFKAKGLQKAKEVLDRDKLTPEERADYNYVQRLRSENLSTIATSKAEAREEVRREYEPLLAEKESALAEKDAALAEKETVIAEKETVIARERAEKEALLAEKREKDLSIIRNSMQAKIPIETIALITGWTEQQIREIYQSLK